MPAPGDRFCSAFNFLVDLGDGFTASPRGSFLEVSGLSSEVMMETLEIAFESMTVESLAPGG